MSKYIYIKDDEIWVTPFVSDTSMSAEREAYLSSDFWNGRLTAFKEFQEFSSGIAYRRIGPTPPAEIRGFWGKTRRVLLDVSEMHCEKWDDDILYIMNAGTKTESVTCRNKHGMEDGYMVEKIFLRPGNGATFREGYFVCYGSDNTHVKSGHSGWSEDIAKVHTPRLADYIIENFSVDALSHALIVQAVSWAEQKRVENINEKGDMEKVLRHFLVDNGRLGFKEEELKKCFFDDTGHIRIKHETEVYNAEVRQTEPVREACYVMLQTTSLAGSAYSGFAAIISRDNNEEGKIRCVILQNNGEYRLGDHAVFRHGDVKITVLDDDQKARADVLYQRSWEMYAASPYKIIGQLYEENPTFEDWDTEKAFPFYLPVKGSKKEWRLDPKEVFNVDGASKWLLKNHPDYWMGANIIQECPSGNTSMHDAPCAKYGTGYYENYAARYRYAKEEAARRGIKTGVSEVVLE